ncbi:MAG: TonB-dependent receptor [bacterium]
MQLTRLARWKSFRLPHCLALLCLALSAQTAAAQGTITGRITNESGLPLAGAKILAVGTPVTAVANDDGRYFLRNVRAGNIEVQVLLVGYKSQKQTVVVASGTSTESNFRLGVALVQLTEIVTTATGQQRKIELGNAVATLGDVNKRVEESSVTNIADLMTGKTPGVIILPSPVVGGAPTIRLRGVSSISLSNAPIWYVDGVRWTTSTSMSTGIASATGSASSSGSTPISPLNNLSPEEIEDIEIVKGPSAATLYGTNAANGVIVVTTKKGKPGSARWGWTGESRTISDRWDYQDQYANFGHKFISTPGALFGTLSPTASRCQLAVMETSQFKFIDGVSGATCRSDSLTHYDYLTDPEATFIHLGRGSLYGMNVSGGTDALRYFVSGDLDNEFGPIQMAQRDIDYYQNVLSVPVTNSMFHPRSQQKLNFRTNLQAAVSPKLDLSVSSGFAKSSNIIEPDNAQIIALLYLGQSNFGYKGCPVGTEKTGCGLDKPGGLDPTGFPFNDANSFAPGSVMQFVTPVDAQRFTGSAQANWRPLAWMQNDAVVGVDLLTQDISHVCRLNECPASGANARVGNVFNQKDNRRNFSAKVASTATWQAKSWANLRTTVGADYTNEERDELFAQGRGLAIGASSLAATSTFVSITNVLPTAAKTLGYYAQEQLALRDRLFLTAGLRSDQNSAFGTSFQRILYPKIGLSWIITDEPFFPKRDWLTSLQLRSAYGANGVQPLPTAALQLYTPAPVSVVTKDLTSGTDQSGLVALQPGNTLLKPERSTELETGFAADMFDRRVHLDYTYYKKQTTDALIAVPIPSSTGAPGPLTNGNPSLQLNLGSTQNSGHEFQANVVVWDSPRFSWDVTGSISHNNNKWVDLGIDPATGNERIIGAGGVTQQRQGYPLFSQWYRNYTFADANGDGVIQKSEVAVDSALSFQGVGFAKDLASIASGIDLFHRKLRFNVLFDHKGGGRTLEGNYFQCASAPQACQETQDPTSPLWMQARAVANSYGTKIGGTTYTTRLGYFVPFDFWKLRELSAVVSLPERLTSAVRASNGSTLVVAVRNLKTWSNFTGVDPEQNYGTTASEVANDFNTSPTPTYFTFRLNLKF